MPGNTSTWPARPACRCWCWWWWSARAARWGAAALWLLAAAEFLVSTETCATAALVGALAWGLALALVPAWRAALVQMIPEAAAAGMLAVLLVSPVLYAMFALPRDIHLPPHWPGMFSTDLLNLVVPTLNTALGGASLFSFTQNFPGLLGEQVGYLGVPLLVLLVLFLRRQMDGRGWFFGVLLGGIVLLSLGPHLWVGGVRTAVPLPWALVERLPLLESALPARLMEYAALLSAVMAALYLAQSGARGGSGRLALVACIALIPVPHLTGAAIDILCSRRGDAGAGPGAAFADSTAGHQGAVLVLAGGKWLRLRPECGLSGVPARRGAGRQRLHEALFWA